MRGPLIVILEPEMRDEFFAYQMPKRVLQLHQLNENIVFGIKPRSGLRCLEIERKPFLHALHSGPLREIHEERQIESKRCGEDRIAAHEIDLDLHLVAEPAEDVDRVPAFLVVAARRIIIDPDDVREIFRKGRGKPRAGGCVRAPTVSTLPSS